MRNMYQNDSVENKSKYNYELMLIHYCEDLVSECDRSLARNKAKIEAHRTAGSTQTPEQARIVAIDTETDLLIRRIEALGEQDGTPQE